MAEEKTRVDFTVPASLVERADRVVDILDISRTRLLTKALENKLEELADDEAFRRRLDDAYYDGQVDFETVASILGREEALQMKLLKDSIDREPPKPALTDNLPADKEFYDDDVPKWTPDEETSDGPT